MNVRDRSRTTVDCNAEDALYETAKDCMERVRSERCTASTSTAVMYTCAKEGVAEKLEVTSAGMKETLKRISTIEEEEVEVVRVSGCGAPPWALPSFEVVSEVVIVVVSALLGALLCTLL